MHVMVDLETTGLRVTSAILTIGAVWFDENGVSQDSADQIHIPMDWKNQLGMGRTQDDDNVAWWKQQDPRAYEAAWEGDRYYPPLALGMIMGFCMRHPLDGLWGNGAAFDNAILRSVFDTYGLAYRWVDFRKDMCYRTLRALYSDMVLPSSEGVEHNALHDAIFQAERAAIMLRKHHELTSLLSQER